MNTQGRSAIGLLVGKGWAKSEAAKHVKGLTGASLQALYDQLALEARGQAVLPMDMPVKAPTKASKVAYSLLLPPDMLEEVKAAADRDGSTASQFIRTAIAKQLGRIK